MGVHHHGLRKWNSTEPTATRSSTIAMAILDSSLPGGHGLETSGLCCVGPRCSSSLETTFPALALQARVAAAREGDAIDAGPLREARARDDRAVPRRLSIAAETLFIRLFDARPDAREGIAAGESSGRRVFLERASAVIPGARSARPEPINTNLSQ